MFKIEMLAAGHGDCLLIEYGAEDAPYRILIDGGTAGTYERLKKRLKGLSAAESAFELLVITHVDGDHITGVLKLFDDPKFNTTFNDVWFNGWDHLSVLKTLGPVQGEKLTEHLNQTGMKWNENFGRGAVKITDSGQLPEVHLAGGMLVTVLAPTAQRLAKLKPVWTREIRAAGLDPEIIHPEERERDTRPSILQRLGIALPDVEKLAASPFTEHTSEANSSSIVLLMEYDNRRLLLCGDAHPEDLNAAIDRLNTQRNQERLHLDAFKVPHHGSEGNLSNEVLDMVDCNRYLISTNGAYFEHPDDTTVARIIKHGGKSPQIFFNYLSKYNQVWSKESLQNRFGYTTQYPADKQGGLVVNLEQ